MPTASIAHRGTSALARLGWCAATLAAVLAPSPGAAQPPPPTTRQEYVSTARQETVLTSDLVSAPGKVGTVLRVELPKGWVGGWHYHTGDVFVYVSSGQFVVDVEGEGRKAFARGQVYHEAVNTTMRASNPSSTEPTSLILFQVGGRGEPLMLQAKPPVP